MSVNDEALYAGSDSFWEVSQFKRTVDRQENGGKLCDELVKLIRDRANIEKEYANKLKNFSKAWNDRIDKGPEYGTTASAWKGVLTEAESMAEIHVRIREKLLEEVETEIAKWKKENYKKSAIGPCKETKLLDDEFKKAQKPWEKRLSKVKKCRKDYHTACKNEKSSLHQESNARSDSGLSPDQMKKMQDKVDKCLRDVESSKDKYENALLDLNNYNAKYMEDMTEVFNKSQDFEKRRLMFFQEMLFGIHKCLDLSQSAEIPAVYQQYAATINQADSDKDLKWWSMNNGVDMPMNWPQFEPYREEFHDIRGGWTMPGRGRENNTEAVTLRRINLDKHNKEFPEYSPDFHTISRKEKKGGHGGGGGVTEGGITMTSIKRNDSAPPPVQQPTNYNSNEYNSNTTTGSNGITNIQPSSESAASSSRNSVITRKDSYDPHLNPFEDDEEDDDDHDNHCDNTPLVSGGGGGSTASSSNRASPNQQKSSPVASRDKSRLPDVCPPAKPERTFKYKQLKSSSKSSKNFHDNNNDSDDSTSYYTSDTDEDDEEITHILNNNAYSRDSRYSREKAAEKQRWEKNHQQQHSSKISASSSSTASTTLLQPSSGVGVKRSRSFSPRPPGSASVETGIPMKRQGKSLPKRSQSFKTVSRGYSVGGKKLNEKEGKSNPYATLPRSSDRSGGNINHESVYSEFITSHCRSPSPKQKSMSLQRSSSKWSKKDGKKSPGSTLERAQGLTGSLINLAPKPLMQFVKRSKQRVAPVVINGPVYITSNPSSGQVIYSNSPVGSEGDGGAGHLGKKTPPLKPPPPKASSLARSASVRTPQRTISQPVTRTSSTRVSSSRLPLSFPSSKSSGFISRKSDENVEEPMRNIGPDVGRRNSFRGQTSQPDTKYIDAGEGHHISPYSNCNDNNNSLLESANAGSGVFSANRRSDVDESRTTSDVNKHHDMDSSETAQVVDNRETIAISTTKGATLVEGTGEVTVSNKNNKELVEGKSAMNDCGIGRSNSCASTRSELRVHLNKSAHNEVVSNGNSINITTVSQKKAVQDNSESGDDNSINENEENEIKQLEACFITDNNNGARSKTLPARSTSGIMSVSIDTSVKSKVNNSAIGKVPPPRPSKNPNERYLGGKKAATLPRVQSPFRYEKQGLPEYRTCMSPPAKPGQTPPLRPDCKSPPPRPNSRPDCKSPSPRPDCKSPPPRPDSRLDCKSPQLPECKSPPQRPDSRPDCKSPSPRPVCKSQPPRPDSRLDCKSPQLPECKSPPPRPDSRPDCKSPSPRPVCKSQSPRPDSRLDCKSPQLTESKSPPPRPAAGPTCKSPPLRPNKSPECTSPLNTPATNTNGKSPPPRPTSGPEYKSPTPLRNTYSPPRRRDQDREDCKSSDLQEEEYATPQPDSRRSSRSHSAPDFMSESREECRSPPQVTFSPRRTVVYDRENHPPPPAQDEPDTEIPVKKISRKEKARMSFKKLMKRNKNPTDPQSQSQPKSGKKNAFSNLVSQLVQNAKQKTSRNTNEEVDSDDYVNISRVKQRSSFRRKPQAPVAPPPRPALPHGRNRREEDEPDKPQFYIETVDDSVSDISDLNQQCESIFSPSRPTQPPVPLQPILRSKNSGINENTVFVEPKSKSIAIQTTTCELYIGGKHSDMKMCNDVSEAKTEDQHENNQKIIIATVSDNINVECAEDKDEISLDAVQNVSSQSKSDFPLISRLVENSQNETSFFENNQDQKTESYAKISDIVAGETDMPVRPSITPNNSESFLPIETTSKEQIVVVAEKKITPCVIQATERRPKMMQSAYEIKEPQPVTDEERPQCLDLPVQGTHNDIPPAVSEKKNINVASLTHFFESQSSADSSNTSSPIEVMVQENFTGSNINNILDIPEDDKDSLARACSISPQRPSRPPSGIKRMSLREKNNAIHDSNSDFLKQAEPDLKKPEIKKSTSPTRPNELPIRKIHMNGATCSIPVYTTTQCTDPEVTTSIANYKDSIIITTISKPRVGGSNAIAITNTSPSGSSVPKLTPTRTRPSHKQSVNHTQTKVSIQPDVVIKNLKGNISSSSVAQESAHLKESKAQARLKFLGDDSSDKMYNSQPPPRPAQSPKGKSYIPKPETQVRPERGSSPSRPVRFTSTKQTTSVLKTPLACYPSRNATVNAQSPKSASKTVSSTLTVSIAENPGSLSDQTPSPLLSATSPPLSVITNSVISPDQSSTKTVTSQQQEVLQEPKLKSSLFHSMAAVKAAAYLKNVNKNSKCNDPAALPIASANIRTCEGKDDSNHVTSDAIAVLKTSKIPSRSRPPPPASPRSVVHIMSTADSSQLKNTAPESYLSTLNSHIMTDSKHARSRSISPVRPPPPRSDTVKKTTLIPQRMELPSVSSVGSDGIGSFAEPSLNSVGYETALSESDNAFDSPITPMSSM